MHGKERGGDEGFTLIELVITIVVVTVVLGALAMGVVTLLRTSGVTTNRLIGSHDAELLSQWITTDVQSSASAPNVLAGTKPGCTAAEDASLPAVGNVAQMTWTDRSTGFVYHAAYRVVQVQPGPPPRFQLLRYFCRQGQASTRFPVVRALKDGTVCSGGVAGANAVCVLTQPWPRFDLYITSVSGNEVYPFTATATGRTATSGIDSTGPQPVPAPPPGSPVSMYPAVAYNTDAGGNAGRINRVVVTFDEALVPIANAPIGQWTLNNKPNNAAITKVTVANHTATLDVSASGSPVVTTTGGFTISLQADPNGVRDGGGNQAAFSGLAVTDGMAPVIRTAVTADSNNDEQIDQIKVTMSEPVGSNPTPDRFTVDPPPGWGFGPNNLTVIGAAASGTVVTLTLFNSGPTPTPADTFATGFTVAMDAYPDAVHDNNGNFAAWPVTPVGDGVAPELRSLLSQDTNHDGRLDEILATFSEPLQSSTITSQWTMIRPTSWPSRPVVTNVSVGGSVATLTIRSTLNSGAPVPFDTAAAGLRATLALALPGTGIRDAAGNRSAFSNRLVTDGMAPLLRNVAGTMVFNHGTTAGLFESGDSLTATFTEPLPSAGAAAVTVVLTRAPAGPTATLDIPGLTNGAVDVGTNTYFTAAGGTASWSANVSRSGAAVTVTLTSTCSGADCANLTQGQLATTTMNVSPTIVDAAGNVAWDTTLTNIQWF
jgi:prepilin-type N-terminal cleavage/methylation domain-containing protein